MTTSLRLNTLRPLRTAIAVLALAAAGGLVHAAPPMAGGGAGPMMMMGGPGGPGGGPMMMMGGGRHIEQMLDAVNATPEQRSQIKSIMDAARTDLRAQHEAGSALHEQAMQLFAAPSVDARGVEALRQQMLARHDEASKRMMQAMLDTSRVLSPEQRKQMVDLMAQRHSMMERHRAERGAPAKPAN